MPQAEGRLVGIVTSVASTSADSLTVVESDSVTGSVVTDSTRVNGCCVVIRAGGGGGGGRDTVNADTAIKLIVAITTNSVTLEELIVMLQYSFYVGLLHQRVWYE